MQSPISYMLSKLSDFRVSENLAVTIGTFDGVHLGHRAILDKLLKMGKEKSLKTAVLTFPVPPVNFLNEKHKRKKLLIPFEKRVELLEASGIDYIIATDFPGIRHLSAADFVEKVLVKKLNTGAIAASRKFRFGEKREGDINLLKNLSKKFGFEVHIAEMKRSSGKPISSTAIRQALERGDIKNAGKMLGYSPLLEGHVVHGLKIGRQLGFPTANLEIDGTMQIPKEGIYACFVLAGGMRFRGALYIGKRPTFSGKTVSIEASIIDLGFSESLYGKKMEVEIVERIRDDMRFDNEEDLIDQIRKDVEKVEKILTGNEGK